MKPAALLAVLLLPVAQVAADEFDSESPASTRPARQRVSLPLRQALVQMRGELSATDIGRRLLAATEEIPVVERSRASSAAVEYLRGETPVIAVDPDKAESLDQLDFELLFVEARARALAAVPIELADEAWAAQQAVLDYALQKAEARPPFAERLRAATREAEGLFLSRKGLRARAPDAPAGPDLLFPGRRPGETLARLAFDLFVFSEDPHLFYAVVSETGALSPEAVGLGELEGFFEAHGDGLESIVFRGLGRHALVGDRVYPGRLARAARSVASRGRLARIREGLGLYRGVAQKELLARVNRWIRESR